ncbi:uncharacterized protein LOC141834173 [Curcuma longa]|uniref:uncharacterized protein LOC141834173 n=1 Tax=Curcuma longa TaxID=136217 RepID=UPI003D9F0735
MVEKEEIRRNDPRRIHCSGLAMENTRSALLLLFIICFNICALQPLHSKRTSLMRDSEDEEKAAAERLLRSSESGSTHGGSSESGSTHGGSSEDNVPSSSSSGSGSAIPILGAAAAAKARNDHTNYRRSNNSTASNNASMLLILLTMAGEVLACVQF